VHGQDEVAERVEDELRVKGLALRTGGMALPAGAGAVGNGMAQPAGAGAAGSGMAQPAGAGAAGSNGVRSVEPGSVVGRGGDLGGTDHDLAGDDGGDRESVRPSKRGRHADQPA
jgi:hypothetical protein